jgi:hypothetical protein
VAGDRITARCSAHRRQWCSFSEAPGTPLLDTRSLVLKIMCVSRLANVWAIFFRPPWRAECRWLLLVPRAHAPGLNSAARHGGLNEECWSRIRKLTGSVPTESHGLSVAKHQLRLNRRVQADITPFGEGTGSAKDAEHECCHAERSEASRQFVVG